MLPIKMVPEIGIEPIRCLSAKRRILSPLCLPISPLGHECLARLTTEQGRYCKTDAHSGDETNVSLAERQLSDQLRDGGECAQRDDDNGAKLDCQALFEDREFLLDDVETMIDRCKTLIDCHKTLIDRRKTLIDRREFWIKRTDPGINVVFCGDAEHHIPRHVDDGLGLLAGHATSTQTLDQGQRIKHDSCHGEMFFRFNLHAQQYRTATRVSLFTAHNVPHGLCTQPQSILTDIGQ